MTHLLRRLPSRPLSHLTSSPTASATHQIRPHSSVSADELSHFSALASSWWDPMGPSRVLHLMNPLRHDFIASCLADTYPRHTAEGQNPKPGLNYLDIGCGGGIFAESLARTIPTSTKERKDGGEGYKTGTRAASITALDPSPTLIKIARDHARLDPVVEKHLADGRFRYLNCSVEEHLSQLSSSSSPSSTSPNSSEAPSDSKSEADPKKYDLITLFEVLEHIDPTTSSPLSFLTTCLRLLNPGGWLIGSTIARSLPSFIVNQVIAEAPWPFGVVPRGTHEWGKFVNPDELRGWAVEGLERAE
ncbi:hexaprenyldihydroxybenzoate methyltransferase, partial [Aspergillus sclerotialis]